MNVSFFKTWSRLIFALLVGSFAVSSACNTHALRNVSNTTSGPSALDVAQVHPDVSHHYG